MSSVKGAFEIHRKKPQLNFYTYKKNPIITIEYKVKSSICLCMYVFGHLLGHADWLGQEEQQPYGFGITETDRSGTVGGDGPAAFEAGRNAQ